MLLVKDCHTNIKPENTHIYKYTHLHLEILVHIDATEVLDELLRHTGYAIGFYAFLSDPVCDPPTRILPACSSNETYFIRIIIISQNFKQ